MSLQAPFKLERFTVMPHENKVVKSDEQLLIQPKFIDVLAYLATQYPRLVSREELIENIWEGNQYVGEKALTNAIWNLRKALKSDDVQFIETVRKTGYRLLIEPEYLPEPVANLTQTVELAVEPQQLNKSRFSLGKLIGVVLFLSFIGGLSYNLVVHFIIEHQQDEESALVISNLTAAPGRELYPAVSHDQRYLIYSWRRINQKADIFLKDLTQPDLLPRQLTFTDESESSPIWGKRGKYIFFVRKSWLGADCFVIKMDIATASEKVVANCPPGINIYLSLTADGNQLAYTGFESGMGTGIYIKSLIEPHLPAIRFSCAKDCNYSDRSIAFSPDGKYAAVSRRAEDLVEDIYLVNLQTKQTQQLTFGEGDIKGFTWTADSKRLVYASKSSLTRSGHIISIDNGKIEPLNVEGFSFPSFIPNSSSLVFHRWNVATFISYLPLAEKVNATPFPLIQSDYSHSSAHYSQARERLTYISNESGYNEIWTANLDGTQRKKLTNLENNLSAPRWSHNGLHIAFLGTVSNRQSSSIYILNVETLAVEELKTEFDTLYRPTWGINDNALIVAAKTQGTSKLYQIPLNGEEPEIVANTPARYAIQTSDKSIWYVKGSKSGLWRVNPSDKKQPLAVIDKDNFKQRYNWTVTDKGVFFQSDYKDHHRIMFYDFAKEQLTPMMKLPSRTLESSGSMSYVAQDDKLLFTQSQFPQVDIKSLSHPLLQ
ncbi:winged helix-turn-helix domain-containing protein [Psychrobium sp. 1_MG-2023]|uniref:winged helix-turn-helix domain-containing protein n=1 Tax=Psychrobium sp. 1_MG-2023 TaxID=3062624 RepID=UPI000C32E30B|nr:winged helix-turn-helix domain-containing protein [Psychrobium sp. 1_MG-2023]MDP2559696.1 winged helix-turn-helix domain-containing protein [Psychrobium sp. 1_MG-2023]PKF59527.1 transcriptional regulator [Alteromonadales bacterium alter-6D02]